MGKTKHRHYLRLRAIVKNTSDGILSAPYYGCAYAYTYTHTYVHTRNTLSRNQNFLPLDFRFPNTAFALNNGATLLLALSFDVDTCSDSLDAALLLLLPLRVFLDALLLVTQPEP
jgi:hypothetical protein